MSRQRPSDTFTRFTSTTPHASQSPAFNSSRPSAFKQQTSDPQKPTTSRAGPPGETAAEKVARLRAENRLAKERAAFSPTDRILARGRWWADFAHRATTYSLLAVTGVSAVVAVYSLISLVGHNRRQKRAWIEREMDRLQQARAAFLRGEADAEQLHLLEQERAGEEIAKKYEQDKEKKKAEGIFGRLKGTFGTLVGQGDRGVEAVKPANVTTTLEATGSQAREKLLSEGWVGDEVAVEPASVQASHIPGVGLDEKGRPVPINKLKKIARKAEDERRVGERAVTDRTGITGGPLDVLADNIADAVTPQQKSSQTWWSWATGGNSS